MQTGPLKRLTRDSNEYIHVTCAMLNKDVHHQNGPYTLRRSALNQNVRTISGHEKVLLCSMDFFFYRHATSVIENKVYVLLVETKGAQGKQASVIPASGFYDLTDVIIFLKAFPCNMWCQCWCNYVATFNACESTSVLCSAPAK